MLFCGVKYVTLVPYNVIWSNIFMTVSLLDNCCSATGGPFESLTSSGFFSKKTTKIGEFTLVKKGREST